MKLNPANGDVSQTNSQHEPRSFLQATGPILCAVAAVTGVVLAWFLPSRKRETHAFENVVYAFGRYSYREFVLAIVVTLGTLTVFGVLSSKVDHRKRAIFRALALWLGVGLSLGTAELIARLLPPLANPFYTFNAGGVSPESDNHPELPYLRPPHLHWEGVSQGDIPEWLPDPQARRLVLKTDWQGFRNSDDIHEADVVFIGDSFTEGGNVAESETFVRKTADQLDVTARNLGLFGYAPQPEWIVLKEFGLPCHPRAVVWQLYEGNDLGDAGRYAVWREDWLARGKPEHIAQTEFRHTSWTRCSPSYRFFSLFVKRQRFWLEGTFREANGESMPVRFSYLPRRDSHLPPGMDARLGWKEIVETISEAKAVLDEQGIKLLVMHIPMKFSVMSSHVEFDEWSRQRMPAGWPFPEDATFAAYLSTLCEKLDIAFVDTTEALEKAAEAGTLPFLPYDTHLSPEGHEVVAEQIAPVLKTLFERSEQVQSNGSAGLR